MKVAVLSESSADEAAIRILVDALLGSETQPVGPLPLRSRGYPAVQGAFPKIIMHLHYRTDADALVAVVDSNGSAVHRPNHEQEGGADRGCRLCEFRRAVSQLRDRLAPRPAGDKLRIAIGLATPAIEAWYLCGQAGHLNEGEWQRDLAGGADPPGVIRGLKRAVYGTEIPSLPLEERRAKEEARRLAADLTTLEAAFPNGFGPLARQVRSW